MTRRITDAAHLERLRAELQAARGPVRVLGHVEQLIALRARGHERGDHAHLVVGKRGRPAARGEGGE
jgi:hypothetical protein